MINCVILEERLDDRHALQELLISDNRFNLKGTCGSIKQLIELLNDHDVQLVLADALIGRDKFLNSLSQLPYKPELIIVSADTQFALPAIANDVVHYIAKPIKRDDLLIALDRAYKKIQLMMGQNNFTYFFLQTGKNRFNRISFDELILVEADGEYLKLHLTDNREVVVFKRLKSLLIELPSRQFKQVHRSYIVNIDFIDSIDVSHIGMKNRRLINVGKTYKSAINEMIRMNGRRW